MIKLTDIQPNPNNPRLIRDDKFNQLKVSIEQFPKMMALRPIVVDASGMVLGGNMRLRALQDLKYKEVPDEWVRRAEDLTEDEKRRFIIADNTGFGQWDWDVLANEWDAAELAEWGLDVPEEWGEEELEAEEDDYTEPENIQVDVVPGDLIEIGRHRLLCGDSTNADDVGKLLNGNEPELMVTDPPYGVDYDPNWRNEMDRANGKPYGERAVGLVNNDDRINWTPSYALSPCFVAYLWHAGRHAKEVQQSLEDAGFEIRAQIVWAKSNFAISRGHYHWQHEPCWYAFKKGKSANWIGDNSQTTLWHIDKPMKSETGHSTQKPVDCMGRPIQNHKGDVYDPFLGSGTTMVAAHQLNRTCYGMEIDPKYCQVVIDRMRKLDPALDVKINGKKYEPKQEEEIPM